MKLILIVLLGCNIFNILNSRVNKAVDFVKGLNVTKEMHTIDWLLSGGNKELKNADNSCYEGEIMKHRLQSFNIENIENNYSIDTRSINTAENFAYLDKFLQINSYYDDIYIVTSEYHYPRANKILNRIIPKIRFKWILAEESNPDSKYWEEIHLNNIADDVKKAIDKYNVTNEELKNKYEIVIEEL